MTQRILSTVGIWLGIIGLIYFGGPQGGIWLVTVASFLTQLEIYRILDKLGYKPMQRLGLTLGTLALLGQYYELPFAMNNGEWFTLAFVLMTSMALFRERKPEVIDTLAPTLLAYMIAPLTFSFFVVIVATYPQGYQGVLMGVWILAVTKFNDVGALLVGRQLGRNKFAPMISPGKTWEGVAGGIVTAALMSVLYFVLLRDWLPESFTLWQALWISVPVAVVGTISDLLASGLKRQAGIKDSGKLVPGIGGAYDLCDSLVLAVPAGWLCLKATLYWSL